MSYQTTVAADSPLYYWTLNATSGNDSNLGSSENGTNNMVPLGTPTQNTTALFTGLGTAWTFNGSSSCASPSNVIAGLSGLSIVTFECIFSIPSYGTTDHLLAELSDDWNSNDGAMNNDPNNGAGTWTVGWGNGSSAIWADRFARPSAATGHHFVHVMNRTARTNTVYIDGVSQSLTASTQNAGTGTTFKANRNLYIASRHSSTLFCAITLQHIALYSGDLGQTKVTTHAVAAGAAVGTGIPARRRASLLGVGR